MMKVSSMGFIGVLFFVCSAVNAATITVNVDLNGRRDGEVGVGTFTGQGAAGGGTVFNGILVDSNFPSPNNDNVTAVGTNLLTDVGAISTIGISVGPGGGDTNGGDTLFDDYLFVASAGAPTTTPFTISGLPGSTADLYFYVETGDVFISGQSQTTFSPTAPFNQTGGNGNTIFYQGVPVVGGQILGTIGTGGVTILNGLTIVAELPPAPVPEPTSAVLLGVGALGLVMRTRRLRRS